jgi:hypothetical protein
VVVDVVEGRKEKVKEEESLSIYTQETPAKWSRKRGDSELTIPNAEERCT